MQSTHTKDSTTSATGPGSRIRVMLDPGIRIAGPAIFCDQKLIATTLITNPAKTGNGLAACVSMGREVAAWVLHTMRTLTLRIMPDEVVTEWPHIYARRIMERKTREDPNDLPPLAGVGCVLGAMFPSAVLLSYEPAAWKGQVPGDAFSARILERLDRDEIEVLAKAVLRTDPILYTDRIAALLKHGTAHNAIDGIGIGLHHLGRLKRRRFYSRG